MKYATSAAFRRALEDRLRVQSLQTGLPLQRLRKLVVFDRLLARLTLERPSSWILKGGFALQLRLGALARTTKDVDLLMRMDLRDVEETLRTAAARDVDDSFQFNVAQAESISPDGGNAYRFSVQAQLDSRAFETFHVDISLSDPVIEPADQIAIPSLLEFADIPTTVVPCYPVTQHIAEKMHAYTLPRLTSENTRLKDLVDILLMAGLSSISAASLKQALQATFDVRQTHPLPSHLPDPPAGWEIQFRRQTADLHLNYATLEGAVSAARLFINPVLNTTNIRDWDPYRWEWQT